MIGKGKPGQSRSAEGRPGDQRERSGVRSKNVIYLKGTDCVTLNTMHIE